jgi:uncharacterized protein (DUF934 family)
VSALVVKPEQDPWQLGDLGRFERIDLRFEKFTDGRAYTQANVIRQRLGFKGALRATGDVLVDQVAHMVRVGFDEIQLRHDQSLATAEKALAAFTHYYQAGLTVTVNQPRIWIAEKVSV